MPSLSQQPLSAKSPAQGAPSSGSTKDFGSNQQRNQNLSGSLEEAVQGGARIGPGATGPAVVELQKLLGLGAGGQTGTYGPTTREAVLKFQKENSIQTTGEVGETTLKALRASGGDNALLFKLKTGGASSETTHGQGVSSKGAAASDEMAKEIGRAHV